MLRNLKIWRAERLCRKARMGNERAAEKFNALPRDIRKSATSILNLDLSDHASIEEFRRLIRVGGMGNYTWEKVGYQQAINAWMSNPYYGRVINDIVKLAMTTKIVVKKRTKSEVVNDPDCPLAKLIMNPNEWLTWPRFIQRQFYDYFFGGDTIALLNIVGTKHRNPATSFEILPMLPGQIVPEMDSLGYPKHYRIAKNGEVVESKYILHWWSFDPMKMVGGLSSLNPVSRSVRSHNLATEHQANSLENDSVPPGFMKTDVDEDDFEDVKKEIAALRSMENRGKLLVLNNTDAKFESLGQTNRDMEFTGGKKQNAEEICVGTGTPVELVIPEYASYNNRDSAGRQQVANNVLTFLDDFLGVFNKKVSPHFTDKETGAEYFIEADKLSMDAFQREAEEKAARLLGEVDKGTLTRNEYREATGRERSPDPAMDQFTVTGMVSPVGDGLDRDMEDEA